MGNVMLNPQIVMVSTLMLIAIVCDCYFLVSVTIKSGRNGEKGHCFGGIILLIMLLVLAGVFGYFAGITKENIMKFLKLPLVPLIYVYGELTWSLADKRMKQGDKKNSYAYRVIAVLAGLGAIILYIRILTG